MAKKNGKNPTTIELTFIKERETKGAIRYQETDEDGDAVKVNEGALIGTMYLRKDKIEGNPPESFKATITY